MGITLNRLRSMIGKRIGAFPGDAKALPGLCWPHPDGSLPDGWLPGRVDDVWALDNGEVTMEIALDNGGRVEVLWSVKDE